MLPSTRSALTAILRTDPSITIEARAAITAAFTGKPDTLTPTAARILRRGEVAKRFGVCLRAVDGWARAGIIQKVCLPGRVRCAGFRESDVAALIEGKEAGHVQ